MRNIHKKVEFCLSKSRGVQPGKLQEDGCLPLHTLHRNMLIGAVEGVTARSQVRAGESHKGQARAIGAAADRVYLRLDADAPGGLLGVADEMHMRSDHLSHIAVLLLDRQGHGARAVDSVHIGRDLLQQGQPLGEIVCAVITDDIFQLGRFDIPAHIGQVEKALVALGTGGYLVCRQTAV